MLMVNSVKKLSTGILLDAKKDSQQRVEKYKDSDNPLDQKLVEIYQKKVDLINTELESRGNL